MRKLILQFQIAFISTSLFAQGVNKAPVSIENLVVEYLPWLMLFAMMVLVAVIFVLINFINELLEYIPEEGFIKKDTRKMLTTPEPDFITRIFNQVESKLTNAVPVEREKEIEFAHEYDGIRELDNSLPPWWKYMFYLSIIFSGIYLYRYHISHSAPLSLEEYQQELSEAEVQKAAYLEKAANMVNESSVAILTDVADVARGKKVYSTYCVPCHGGLGEGGVGPNLTDEYWLHGGSMKDVFKTIKYGFPAKGMISWQTQLRPREMQEVASYIMSLYGTNPPNAKAPQGDKYVPEDSKQISQTN